MFYAGDGVSDLSAAKETDLLFAKKGHGKRTISQIHIQPGPPPKNTSNFNPNRQQEVTDKRLPLDLITYCVRESVPFTVFEDWSSILADVKKVVAGETTVQELSASGLAEFKKSGSGV